MFSNAHSLTLSQSLLIVNFSLKSFAITVFNHHQFEIIILVNVIALQKMRTITHIHQFWLWLAKPDTDGFYSRISLLTDISQVHKFQSYLSLSLIIHASIDLSIWTFSNDVINDIFIDNHILESPSSGDIILIGQRENFLLVFSLVLLTFHHQYLIT